MGRPSGWLNWQKELIAKTSRATGKSVAIMFISFVEGRN